MGPDERAVDEGTAGGVAIGAGLERLVPALVDRLPRLLGEVRDLLGEDWPDYAQFMADQHDEVAVAAEAFMHWLVELAQEGLSHPAGHTVPEPGAQVTLFEEIGRIQWREGRELSTLLSAYQVGARVAWHHVSGTALETGGRAGGAGRAGGGGVRLHRPAVLGVGPGLRDGAVGGPRSPGNGCATNWSTCCCPTARTRRRCRRRRSGPVGRCPARRPSS